MGEAKIFLFVVLPGGNYISDGVIEVLALICFVLILTLVGMRRQEKREIEMRL
jgi:hypothetical protein